MTRTQQDISKKISQISLDADMISQLTSFKTRSTYTKLALFEETGGLEKEKESKEGERGEEEEVNKNMGQVQCHKL